MVFVLCFGWKILRKIGFQWLLYYSTNINPRAQDWPIHFRLSIQHSMNMRGSNSLASLLLKPL